MLANERKKIGKYEVVDVIGQGGMGIVYRAVDPGIGRTVAIKMTTGAIVGDLEMLKRFTREAQSVGSLQHPNIVTVYDLGVEEQNPYLVMELLDGESLESLVRTRRSMSLEEKLEIIVQICNGIQYAHQRNVIHRDIKPANIMILKDGTAKIVDFGIARAGMQKLTRPGQLVGSFEYMSPEQINATNVDARTDIFSIGVLLFELVAGKLPFDGKDTGEVLMKILHQPAPSLSALAKDCPPRLDEIVQRALAKDQEQRYQTAEELSLDLGHVLEDWRRERISEYLQGAEAAAAQGQWSRSKEQLMQVLKRDRQNTRANAMLREVQLEIQKLQRSDRAKELLAEAEHELAQSDVNEALTYLNEAVELDRNNLEILRLRDSLQENRERGDKLHGLMQRAELAQDAGDLEEARQAVEEGLALDPKNTDFRSLQIVLDRELAGRDKQKRVQEFLGEARKEISSRRFTGALEVLRKAESLDPSASVVQELIVLASTGQQQEKRRQELERLTAQIEEAMAKEDYKTAAARIEEGLRSYPDDRGLLKLEAVVRKQQEDTEKSRYVERQTSQARRLMDGGQAADALSLLQSAIERYPAEPSIQAMLAMVQQNIDRTGKEQEKTEVIQAARDAIRRKAYSIAIAILEAARKKATSNEYDELLQFAQNEGENKAKRQKIDAVAEEARRLTSEDKYAEAIALLKTTLQEIPDQELEIVLADFERHVGELNDGVEKSVATVERLLRQDRYAEAIKLLEGQNARFANSPKFRETLRNVRERQRAVRVVSELKEEVRNALSAGDMARAQVLCQEFRKTDNAPDISLVEKEIEARRSEAANAQLETALRDARLLITVQSPGAAMSVLESIESVVPFAGPDLRQRFVGLKTAAENAQRQAMQRAGIPAPAGRAAIESAEETQIADPEHLQSMLAEVSLIATNYRDDEKVQSAIYSVKQKLSDRIQVLRESSVQNLTTPTQGASPALPVNTATSLTPLVQENKPWGSTRLAHSPTPPAVAKPAGPTDSPPAPPQPVTGGKRIPAQSAQSAKIPAGQTLPRIGVPPIPVRPPHGEAPGFRQRVERLPGTVSRQLAGGVLGKIILAVAVVVVLSAIWALRRGKTTSPPPPAPSQKLISMGIHTSPPGATITVDNEVRGISDLQLNLMAGKYRLQADLSGYLPAKASLEVKSGAPNSIDLTLQPAMPTVKLSSDTGVGRVVLDNLPPIDLAGEQRTLDGVAAGNHKLNFDGPQGNASFSFSTGAGTLPIVTSPIAATRLVAVVAASQSSLVHVYCSQPNVDASLDDQPSAKLSREGLELAGVSGGRHQLLIKDGGNQFRMEINVGPIPALTTFLQSGRITGNLVVITREDGVRVSVDGIAQRALTGGGQMRIPNLDPKEYSIAVSKPGFQPVPSQSTLIRKGEQTTVTFILTPVPRVASLSIRGGPPGSQVFVDDKLAGALLPDGTSTLKNISPGDHTIVLRKDMFEPKRLQKRFVAGSEVVITGTEAALQLATGELRITFSPPDALATVAKAGESPIKVTNGTALKLPPGTYTVAARNADDMTSAKTVEVIASQSRSVNLSLAPNGMSKWEEPSGWKAEQNVFVHRGGGFVLFGTAPTTGVFSFSVELQKGKRLQWFLNYTTPRNYVLFQMDENYFYRSTIRNGEATVEIKTPHKIHKGAFQSIRVRVTPDEILTQIKEGTSWFDLDKWSSIGTNLAQGKFGFYLPGKDQIAMMNFNHYPDLDVR